MATKQVDIVFRAVNKVSPALAKMTASLRDSHKQWERAGRQIQRTGKKIQNVGSSLTKSVTVPIVGAGAVAVKKFAEVDKTMSLVKGTMGKTKFAAGDLEKAMQTAAANSTFGMNDAANAALNFARGGWDAQQASAALAPAMNLAAGAGGDLDTVSSGLMATMNAFKAPAGDASKYADIFANACNNSALDVNSLSESMSVAAPIFQTSGGTIKDATLAMGIMANNGTKANVAANSLKTGMARLASPAKDGAKWMKQLGINAFDSNGKMKSMEQIQGELHKSFGKLTSQQKEEAAAAIFGKNQMASWLGLIETSPDKVNKLSGALDQQNTAQKTASAMMEGFGGSIEKLKSSFDVFATTMGGTIAKVLTPWVSKVQKVMDAFNNMDEKQRQTIVKFALMAAAAGPALMVFGKLVFGVGKAVTIIGKFGGLLMQIPGIIGTVTAAFAGVSSVGGVFTALGTSILAILGPVGTVIAALAALIGIGIAIYKNWDKIRALGVRAFKKLTPVINAFKKTAASMKDTVVKGFDSIKQAVQNAVQPISKRIASIKKHLNTLSNVPAFQKFIHIVQDIFMAKLQIALTYANVVFTTTFSIITGIVSTAIETIGTLINAGLKIFDGLVQFITGVFSGNWKQAWEGIKTIFSGVFDAIIGIAKGRMNAVISVINGAINGINKIHVTIPSWVPEMGGKSFGVNIPTIPKLAKGTQDWTGGLAMVNERGGEIIDLPKGSRVYPHDQSVQKAYNDGKARGNVSINIPKLADSIVIRENADIDRMSATLAHQLEIALNDYVYGGA